MGFQIKHLLFRSLQAGLKLKGLDVFVHKSCHHYVPDYYGSSAYKQIDIRSLPEFGPLADATIRQRKTLLYYDRLYTIYQSLASLRQLARTSQGFNLAEVGVYKGGTSHFIASTANVLCLGPVTLHGFDTFEGHAFQDVKAGIDQETIQKPGSFNDTELDAVQEYLQEFGNVKLYKGRFQDTCSQIEQLTFHFVHLDVDIYLPTVFALEFFDRRLATGSTMLVDDYGFTSCPGVKQAVDEFLSRKQGYFSLHLLTGQCILVKHQRGNGS